MDIIISTLQLREKEKATKQHYSTIEEKKKVQDWDTQQEFNKEPPPLPHHFENFPQGFMSPNVNIIGADKLIVSEICDKGATHRCPFFKGA